MAIYESEHTKFMREWMAKHPEEAAEQARAVRSGGTNHRTSRPASSTVKPKYRKRPIAIRPVTDCRGRPTRARRWRRPEPAMSLARIAGHRRRDHGRQPGSDRIEIAIQRSSTAASSNAGPAWSIRAEPFSGQHPEPDRVITDEMVADAPPFLRFRRYRPRDPLRLRLRGPQRALRLRVRQGEFARIDGTSKAEGAGRTVKFSRALRHHRHGLDALILRHGLTCKGPPPMRWATPGTSAEVRSRIRSRSLSAFATGLMRCTAPRRYPRGALEHSAHATVYLFSGDGSGALC